MPLTSGMVKARGSKHCAQPGSNTLPAPQKLRKRGGLKNCGLPPPPVVHRRPCLPVLSRMSIMCWATVFAASSQLMRSHWLPGLAPTRFMGYLLRLG